MIFYIITALDIFIFIAVKEKTECQIGGIFDKNAE